MSNRNICYLLEYNNVDFETVHIFFRASSETVGENLPRNNSILGSLVDNAKEGSNPGIPLIVDLAFASNVRFLDEHELHLNDIELYKVTSIL